MLTAVSRAFEVSPARLKSKIAKTAFFVLKLLSKTKRGQNFLTLGTLFTINQFRQTTIRGQTIYFSFVSGTWLNRRFLDIENLEPDTLTWIDEMVEGSILWDVGANVGSYSIYAAISKNMSVVAFEPSPFNLEFLTRNIWLNKLENKITVIPVALSEFTSRAQFSMKRIEWAGSGSTFEEHRIQNLDNESFNYTTIGLSADKVCETFNLPYPDYLKLDVDGIEAAILAGSPKALLNLRSILVELPETEFDKEQIYQHLNTAGLTLCRNSGHNEIWSRP